MATKVNANTAEQETDSPSPSDARQAPRPTLDQPRRQPLGVDEEILRRRDRSRGLREKNRSRARK